jgi:Fe-Mn family superoxide dismutase
MQHYEEKKFDIPKLKGISAKNIEEHLKLYSGYVKNTNNILSEVDKLASDSVEDHAYAITEMQRRFSFEFNGMRNHEYYFSAFEGGASQLLDDSELKKAIEKEWGSFDSWLNLFKGLAKTRGVGWINLYYDKNADRLVNGWVDEQHLGHLNGLQPVLCLDMWEHSFVADYQPSGKGQYIEDFFENLNWQKIEENFAEAKK